MQWLERGEIERYSGVNHNKTISGVQRLDRDKLWSVEELRQLPSTRGEAVKNNMNIYFSGKLCKHEHLSPRTIEGKCRECKKEREHKYYLRKSIHRKKVINPAEIIANKKLHMSINEAIQNNVKYFYPNQLCTNGHRSAWVKYKRASPRCLICTRKNGADHARKTFKPKGYSVTNDSISTAGFLYNSAKQRISRKKNNEVVFDIKPKDIVIPKYCPIFGIKLNLEWGGKPQTNTSRARAISLDRIDTSKGYTKDNIMVLSYRANIVKGQGTAEEHLAIAKFMSTNPSKTS